MTIVDQLSNVLLALLGSGAGLRIIMSFISMMTQPDEAEHYKKRIINALIFCAIAFSVLGLKTIIIAYFTAAT